MLSYWQQISNAMKFPPATLNFTAARIFATAKFRRLCNVAARTPNDKYGTILAGGSVVRR